MKVGNLFLNTISKTPALPVRKYPNLAPLGADTISFTSRGKRAVSPVNEPVVSIKKTSSSKAKRFDTAEVGSNKLAQDIYKESDWAFNQLKSFLNYTFDTSVIDLDEPNAARRMAIAAESNKNSPVVMITARRKHPDSIFKKMSAKKIRSKGEARKELNDLIGAKIVLSGTSTKEGDYVIDRLTDAVKKGRIKLKSVKIHGQEDKKLNYVSDKKLKSLVSTARNNGSPSCTFVDEPRDTGYLAIHLLTDEIADGYSSEIQIMGIDVEKFKELEDLCYKSIGKKRISPKYEPIYKLYKEISEDDLKLQEYCKYAKEAYAFERLKPVHDKSRYGGYLPIPKDVNLPKELDYNNIAKIKEMIDRKKLQAPD